MNDHDRQPVAHRGPCRIDQCECGVLHVTVGMITLRLQPTTARALAEALELALAQSGCAALASLAGARWND